MSSRSYRGSQPSSVARATVVGVDLGGIARARGPGLVAKSTPLTRLAPSITSSVDAPRPVPTLTTVDSPPVLEVVQRAHVRVGEVVDVDVVADRGAVGRGVVGAVDGEQRDLAERGLHRERHQVEGSGVVLADAGVGRRRRPR